MQGDVCVTEALGGWEQGSRIDNCLPVKHFTLLLTTGITQCLKQMIDRQRQQSNSFSCTHTHTTECNTVAAASICSIQPTSIHEPSTSKNDAPSHISCFSLILVPPKGCHGCSRSSTSHSGRSAAGPHGACQRGPQGADRGQNSKGHTST